MERELISVRDTLTNVEREKCQLANQLMELSEKKDTQNKEVSMC